MAVLLINSTDSLTLNPQLGLDDYCVLVPVYVISCVQGDEIIHHIRILGDCYCQFDFSSTDSKECKLKQNHGNSLLAFIIIIYMPSSCTKFKFRSSWSVIIFHLV